MNQPLSRPQIQGRRTQLLRSAILCCSLLTVTACGSGGQSPDVQNSTGGLGTTAGGSNFFLESNQSGDAQAIHIKGVLWGRLVDVFDTLPNGDRRLLFEDFLIGNNIESDGVNFSLDSNPVTGQEQLVVLRELTTEADFLNVRATLESNLQPLLEKSTQLGEVPPFSAVPRNSAMAIVFDDLIDPATVDETTVRVEVGNPPSTPFEARIIPDVNHGGFRNGTQFFPTRVIVDLTVSQLEAQQTTLPVNGLGLPEAPTTTQANVGLRFPTLVSSVVGQTRLLQNPSQHELASTGNGPVLAGSLTGDVVRGFRSGVSADPFNGFLSDESTPDIVGLQTVLVSNVFPQGGDEYLVDVTFNVPACSAVASQGDVIQTSQLFVEVTENTDLTGSSLLAVPVRVLNPDSGVFANGSASFLSGFDPDSDKAECFVRFNPPANVPPNIGVGVDSEVIVRFSESMDPDSVLPFETFSLTPDDTSGLTSLEDNVVGSISASPDLREFRFVPSVDLAHIFGEEETYLANISSSLLDLAGNPVSSGLGSVPFELDALDATRDTGNVSLTFESLDEDGMAGPEITGQFLQVLDQNTGTPIGIQPRSVQRFSAVLDEAQPMLSAMTVFVNPILTPHSGQGSKLQTVWRHVDMGFPLFDTNFWNIDVEGLAWAPFGGTVAVDSFDEFQIRLSHSFYLPDEFLNPMFLLPDYTLSGLVKAFDNNILGEQQIVHPRELGYTIQPLDAFPAATGRTMVPWPLNRNLPISERNYFTWRDTTERATGAPSGAGSDPEAFEQKVNPTEDPDFGQYNPTLVPTIGLPLLMEIRCYPDQDAFGQNGVQIALALNSSARPFFRVFSTGGVNSSGNFDPVDPDNEPIASGGFSPGAGGAMTSPNDNSFLFGQADFVVRVSRVHTIWFDARDADGAVFAQPVIEPATQPTGTEVVLNYRGATMVGGSFSNANHIGAYGDEDVSSAVGTNSNVSATFLNNDASWKTSIHDIDGASFFQVRMTFISNPESLLTPRVTALGFGFDR